MKEYNAGDYKSFRKSKKTTKTSNQSIFSRLSNNDSFFNYVIGGVLVLFFLFIGETIIFNLLYKIIFPVEVDRLTRFFGYDSIIEQYKLESSLSSSILYVLLFLLTGFIFHFNGTISKIFTSDNRNIFSGILAGAVTSFVLYKYVFFDVMTIQEGLFFTMVGSSLGLSFTKLSVSFKENFVFALKCALSITVLSFLLEYFMLMEIELATILEYFLESLLILTVIISVIKKFNIFQTISENGNQTN